MNGFIERFETQPVKFQEKGCDTVFEARVKGALYVNELEEGAYGATRNEQIENLKAMACEKVESCLSHWQEGDKTLLVDGREELGLCLTLDLKEKGVNGSARVDDVSISDKELYQERIMKPLKEKKAEQRRKEIEEADEPHGPLRDISYNRSSHGMMAGTSSSDNQKIKWEKDGTALYVSYSSFGGKSFNSEYKISAELAQKFIDFVTENKLVAISKLKIPTINMCDNFTSSTISMTFDDSSIGGQPYVDCCIHCGPAGMTFQKFEDRLIELFDECRNTGEIVKNETHEIQNGMIGLMGLGGMGTMNDKQAMPPSALAAFSQAMEATKAKWKCSCGAENGGKFCTECGQPKPVAK